MRRDSPLTSPRGRASGYRVVVEQSRQLATGWMVGSSPRCADSFSPTKSRKRLSDASLEPNWRILVHPSQGLESFFFFSFVFFWTVRECPNAIRVLSFVSGIRQEKGFLLSGVRCHSSSIIPCQEDAEKASSSIIRRHLT